MGTEPPERILPTGLPAISIDVKDQIFGLANIIGDCKKIGEIAAKHFLERGFKNFAFCGYDDIHWSRERCDSYMKYLQQAGHKTWLYKQPTSKKSLVWEDEKKYLIDWLESLPCPIAIMCCNDDRADNVLESCKDCQLNVPDDIAVLGVDNDDMVCKITEPSLSSIDMNFKKAGFEAAQILDRWMKGENMANSTIMIHPTLVTVRQSTDILAMDDREVANAIRYINEHVRKPIQVSDIANDVAISRRMLEKRFKLATGNSIGAYLRKVKADYIAKLLSETNMSLSEIASSLGFSSGAHLTRYFQKEFNMKPSHYRQK